MTEIPFLTVFTPITSSVTYTKFSPSFTMPCSRRKAEMRFRLLSRSRVFGIETLFTFSSISNLDPTIIRGASRSGKSSGLTSENTTSALPSSFFRRSTAVSSIVPNVPFTMPFPTILKLRPIKTYSSGSVKTCRSHIVPGRLP